VTTSRVLHQRKQNCLQLPLEGAESQVKVHKHKEFDEIEYFISQISVSCKTDSVDVTGWNV